MNAVIILLILSISTKFISSSFATRRRYDDFIVYSIQLNNDTNVLLNMTEGKDQFNLWRVGNGEIHLMVGPDAKKDFFEYTKALGVTPIVMIDDVQGLLESEDIKFTKASVSDEFGWSDYQSLCKIYSWLDEIIAKYPYVVEEIVLGQSFEGRPIRGVKISHKPNRPGIFIEATTHAREWPSAAAATWIINELLTSTQPSMRALANEIDWYIIPVFNVDGYEYSQKGDRLWRKNRQLNFPSRCIGTDLNRNFDSYWMQYDGGSADCCSDCYAGTYPNSAPEVKAMSDYILAHKKDINILLAIHAYSQLVLSPYGHSKTEIPPNFYDLLSVAKAYADSVIIQHGTYYDVGAAGYKIYLTSGTTVAFAYNVANISLAYTIELRDQGKHGFLLPADQIIPTCEETMTGLEAMVNEARRLGYLKKK